MNELERLHAEARFLNNIQWLAECYGCTVRVDMGKRIAYFDGDPAQCEALGIKLSEIFKDEELIEVEKPFFITGGMNG